jgi:glycosyltransferase involved in cell wall biosynthesis
MNIHVTSTVGEGCGLPLLESMAVGTPSIAPKHSAIPEMLGDTGRLVKNKAIFSLPNDNGHFRPIIDEEDYLFAMEEAYLKWKKSGKDIEKKPDLIDRALEKFSWVDKRDSLKRIFKSALPT